VLQPDGMGIAETLKARTFLFATAVYRACAAENSKATVRESSRHS
jgi:hypothetical protein